MLTPGVGVIEDFLDLIGLSLREFCEEMSGGWFFGYIDALRSAGWDPIIFLVSRTREAGTDLRHIPSGTRIFVLPGGKPPRGGTRGMTDRWGAFVELALSLAREIRHTGCTAILAHDYEYLRFDLCAILGMMLRVPVYATFQGAIPHTRSFENFVRPITLRAARGLIIGAAGEAKRVIEHYGIRREKIWRIPNPLDLNLWRPIDRQEARQVLGLPIRARIVIYHGRIEMDYKGLDILLDAWTRIPKSSGENDPVLMMVGSGKDDAILKQRLEHSELSGVRWIKGYELDRLLMRQYLSAANFYVLASRREGFPVAPLEAMACGLPIIGTDIAAMLDIIPEGSASGGLIVAREDPIALAEAIQSLLENPNLCTELGQNARHNVEKRFSVQSVARQLDQMLLQSSAGRSS